MAGKPAARQTDPTSCPIPGHGTNPITVGSPNVLFENLPAARQGDPTACGSTLASAVVPNVLINGKPATVVGTVGSHGNSVVAGAGTVIIGTSGGGAPVPTVSPMPGVAVALGVIADALALRAEASKTAAVEISQTSAGAAKSSVATKTAEAAQANVAELDYRLAFKSGGNRVLTPLGIPDHDELASGATQNRETVDFSIRNRKQPANSVKLEVYDGSKLIYTEPDTARFQAIGDHLWQWDGYSQAGVLDTRVLKSTNLVVRLTAFQGGVQQTVELTLNNTPREADWVDAVIDRQTATAQIIVRPSFSDGGVKGSNKNLVAKSFAQLEGMAKAGIEHYWSRNGSRSSGVDAPVQTASGPFRVDVLADVSDQPKAKNFPLIESLDADFGRSTSFAMFKKIYHNAGFWLAARYPADFAERDFAHTAAHEFGHLVLNEYGDGGLIPNYSWSHKETSTVLSQAPKDGNPLPAAGEIDVMHYHSSNPRGPQGLQDYWNRSVASEQDVKGLLWLSRVRFND